MNKEVKKMGEVVKEVATNLVEETTVNATETVAKAEKSKKSKAEDLQQEIERKTEELMKCLAELERKKQLSSNRTAFMQALDQLQEAANQMDETVDFESKLFRLRFEDAGNYRDNEIFRISNHYVLVEFIKFIREKIQIRISEIEMQLMSEL